MDLTAWNWELDGWIVVAGILCALASSLLGNFLVLRRLSLLGDAISHAVLPGLAIAFLISDSRSSWAMFVGAAAVGLLTAFFTEWVRGAGKVDEGASMGVVFTSLFALGLVLIVYTADRVDLDPNCVLFGSIESVPLDTWQFPGWEIPRAVVILSGVTLLNLAFVLIFYKELKLTAFDPDLAKTLGVSPVWMHYGLMCLVAVTAVACFESVGSVLVVAMLVVPAAAAWMLTDRLGWMMTLSAGLAIVSATTGHLSAIHVPRWFGYGSTSTSGMIAVMCGVAFLTCALWGPRYGVIIRWIRQRNLAWQILSDDILAWLYRQEEKGLISTGPQLESLPADLHARPWRIRWSLGRLKAQGDLEFDATIRLTEKGRDRARVLIRSHRLWERYLMDHADLDQQRLHDKAEKLEHFTDQEMRAKLHQEMSAPKQDPHGSEIPNEHP